MLLYSNHGNKSTGFPVSSNIKVNYLWTKDPVVLRSSINILSKGSEAMNNTITELIKLAKANSLKESPSTPNQLINAEEIIGCESHGTPHGDDSQRVDRLDEIMRLAGHAQLDEKWSEKYKKSINCSHPRGFSQKAHCAGKRKHNESTEMEMTCPDCGCCQTHGNLDEIRKGQKDSNGYTRCWPGHHAEGTKKGKNGGQVRNCVPNESQGVAEGDELTHAGQEVMVWTGPPTNNPPRDDKKYWVRGKLVSTEKTGGSMRANVMTAKGMYNPELSRVFNVKQGVAEGSEEKYDFIPVKLLKRNVPYWLTYDFYGHGGKLVKLSGPDPTNNNFIIVKDQDGNEYSVSKKAVLFASDPNQNKGRSKV